MTNRGQFRIEPELVINKLFIHVLVIVAGPY
jgi:hypothetical protein